MGSRPSAFGTKELPVTAVRDEPIVANPVITGSGRSFQQSSTIHLSSNQPGITMYYTLDGTAPDAFAKRYTQPFDIRQTTTVQAIAMDAAGQSSYVSRAVFTQKTNDWSVAYRTPYEKQYSADGQAALIDGIRGSVEWRKGNWQGWQKDDMDVVVHLGQPTLVGQVTVGLLHDINAWICMPRQVSVELSVDGQSFMPFASAEALVSVNDKRPQLKQVQIKALPQRARYVRILARQHGKMPAWHEGAGGDTHIFCDEILIESGQ
jgi:hypothetical protein